MRFACLRNPFVRRCPPSSPGEQPAAAGAASVAEVDIAGPPVRWTASRIAVADALWGEGFALPGGEEEVLRLAAPLGLSEAASVLLLGAAGGGAARAIVTGLGAWISGHEADPALAAIAAWRLPRMGKLVAKRASVVPWNPGASVFRRHGFNHALVLEALRGVPGRPLQTSVLLPALAGALRPGGHLVLVDVVATDRLDPADPLLAAWADTEGRAGSLPTQAALSAALVGLGFDVRVTEDISARHMRLAAQGWQRIVREAAVARPDHERAAALVAEAEVWMRRLRLMHSGQIRFVRWDAICR